MRAAVLSLSSLLAFAWATAAAAQGGHLAGRVTDEAGEPLADVVATLVLVDTGAEIEQVSNKKGRFNMTVANVDRQYEIVLRKPGYLDLRQPVRLQRGDPAQVTWVMVVAGAAQPAVAEVEAVAAGEAKEAAVQLYNAGAQAYNAGDLEGAAAQFDAAIAQDPELTEAYEIAAALNFQIGNYERALELGDSISARDASNASAVSVRYDALNALGRGAEADLLLDQLIAMVPDEETAKRAYNRALAHAKGADLDSAVARLAQAVELSPGLAPAWGLLGDLEIARGNHQRAIDCGDRLLAIEGSRQRGLSLRHRAFEAMGDEANAAEALRALAAEDPDAATNSLFERGSDLFDDNRPAEAAALFRQVLDLQPDNARAHYKLGLALLSAEDLANAKAHLQRFLELAPDDPEAAAARDMLAYLE